MAAYHNCVKLGADGKPVLDEAGTPVMNFAHPVLFEVNGDACPICKTVLSGGE